MSWLLLTALGIPPSQWRLILLPFQDILPEYMPKYQSLIKSIRQTGHLMNMAQNNPRKAHISTPTPRSTARSATRNGQARPPPTPAFIHLRYTLTSMMMGTPHALTAAATQTTERMTTAAPPHPKKPAKTSGPLKMSRLTWAPLAPTTQLSRCELTTCLPAVDTAPSQARRLEGSGSLDEPHEQATVAAGRAAKCGEVGPHHGHRYDLT